MRMANLLWLQTLLNHLTYSHISNGLPNHPTAPSIRSLSTPIKLYLPSTNLSTFQNSVNNPPSPSTSPQPKLSGPKPAYFLASPRLQKSSLHFVEMRWWERDKRQYNGRKKLRLGLRILMLPNCLRSRNFLSVRSWTISFVKIIGV